MHIQHAHFTRQISHLVIHPRGVLHQAHRLVRIDVGELLAQLFEVRLDALEAREHVVFGGGPG